MAEVNVESLTITILTKDLQIRYIPQFQWNVISIHKY